MRKSKRNGHLKIEHDVPLPEEYQQHSYKEYVEMLEPKDSVLLPKISGSSASALAVTVWGKGKCCTRKERGGVRVWRIS